MTDPYDSETEAEWPAHLDPQRTVRNEIGRRVKQQFDRLPKTTRKEAAFLAELVKGVYSPLVAKQLGSYSSDSHRVVRSLRKKGLAVSYGHTTGVVHAGLALDTEERPSIHRLSFLGQLVLWSFSGKPATQKFHYGEIRRAARELFEAERGRYAWKDSHDVEFRRELKSLCSDKNGPPRLFKDDYGYWVNLAAWPADAWFPRPFSAV